MQCRILILIFVMAIPRISAFVPGSMSQRCKHSLSLLTSVEKDARDNSLLIQKSSLENNSDYSVNQSDPLERLANAASDFYLSRVQHQKSDTDFDMDPTNNTAVQIKTLIRVAIPSLSLAIISGLLYSPLCLFIASDLIQSDQGVFTVVSQDSSQYIQNILTTSGLIFSIFTGYTYYFMYQQQEQLYLALFNEVSETKSLLEQVSLVCTGREMYPTILECIQSYVEQDLKYSTKVDPADFLSTRANTFISQPILSSQMEDEKSSEEMKYKEDPLEAIMYMTSVGEPSTIYDTILSLRRARALRLGALQQKLPDLHILLLRVLGTAVLVTFPVCGSGSQVLGGMGILKVQSLYFAFLVFGIAMVLSVITELWKPRGGAYNIDGVLSVMVSGLDEELRDRLSGELESGNPYFVD